MELLGKSKNELRDFCVGLGEPAYRGGQIYHALYAERKSSVREISNLPAGLRERLAAETTITWPAVRQTYASRWLGAVSIRLAGFWRGREKKIRASFR